MKTTAIILTREPDSTGQVISDEALEEAAKDLKEKGVIQITDPEGNSYQAEVFGAEVTDLGLSVTFKMDIEEAEFNPLVQPDKDDGSPDIGL